MTYAGYITRITNVHKHPNADRLAIGECFGNTVVVGLDTSDNQLGIYFPCDGQLSSEFLKANDLIGTVDANGVRSGGFFNESGRVRAQKFRKVKSDGYFCPTSFLQFTGVDFGFFLDNEGKPFTEINGIVICKKYVTEQTTRASKYKPRDPQEETVKFPLFFKHKDTEQLEYCVGEIPMGAVLSITEKVHGTSQRSSNTLKVTNVVGWRKFINNIFKAPIFKASSEYEYVCGTRNVIIKDFNSYYGFKGSVERTVRQESHLKFFGMLEKGETVYYEIVGYFDKDTLIMSTCDNKVVMSDKEFTKKFGNTTTFHYGCPIGEHDVYVYRMTMTNEDGVEIDYDYPTIVKRCAVMNVKVVPLITTIVYKGMADNLINSLKGYLNGTETEPAYITSNITPAHIMEGVVVRVNSTVWKAYKLKAWAFKIIEQGVKDTGVVDVEESS